MLAVLVRGLAGTLLPRVAARVPAPRMSCPDLSQAHRLAAAQGLGGHGLDPVDGRERPAVTLVDALIDFARTALDATDDTEWVRAQWDRIRTDGGGAARQRAVLRRSGRFAAVFDSLAAATVRG